jgi:ABC-type phosphate/phosphonate transport system ATPase subunit
MTVETLATELSAIFARPETDVVEQGLLALVAKETRAAETEIAEIRERYNIFTREALYDAIQEGQVAGHPAWEDYIVWKNKEAHISGLREAGRE